MDYKLELIRLQKYCQESADFINDDDSVPDKFARTVYKEMVIEIKDIIERGQIDEEKEATALLHSVSGMSLSEYAQKKLEYINGSCIAREFPEHQPSKEWAGAVLDLLEDMKLGDYR